jgi:hypothetical protein
LDRLARGGNRLLKKEKAAEGRFPSPTCWTKDEDRTSSASPTRVGASTKKG